MLVRTNSEYPILVLNQASWEVLRGERTVQLLPVKQKKAKRSAADLESWEGVDRDLFERLPLHGRLADLLRRMLHGRQILGLDDLAFGKNTCVLYDVAQLPNIARPGAEVSTALSGVDRTWQPTIMFVD